MVLALHWYSPMVAMVVCLDREEVLGQPHWQLSEWLDVACVEGREARCELPNRQSSTCFSWFVIGSTTDPMSIFQLLITLSILTLTCTMQPLGTTCTSTGSIGSIMQVSCGRRFEKRYRVSRTRWHHLRNCHWEWIATSLIKISSLVLMVDEKSHFLMWSKQCIRGRNGDTFLFTLMKHQDIGQDLYHVLLSSVCTYPTVLYSAKGGTAELLG